LSSGDELFVLLCARHALLQAGPSDAAAAAAEGVLVDEQTNLLSSAQQQEANLLDLDDDSGPSTSGESHVTFHMSHIHRGGPTRRKGNGGCHHLAYVRLCLANQLLQA
jgi:hypothetical protein